RSSPWIPRVRRLSSTRPPASPMISGLRIGVMSSMSNPYSQRYCRSAAGARGSVDDMQNAAMAGPGRGRRSVNEKRPHQEQVAGFSGTCNERVPIEGSEVRHAHPPAVAPWNNGQRAVLHGTIVEVN